MSLSAARERALEYADRLTGFGPIAVRRFFSGADLAKDGVQFAMVIHGTLYLRVDDDLRRELIALGSSPFSYPGRKGTVTVARYHSVPDEIAEDEDELRRWAVRAYRAAQASPRGRSAPRKPRSRTPKPRIA